MSQSAESIGGRQGHAFLAEWYRSGDLTLARQAFTDILKTPPPEIAPGVLSYSGMRAWRTCPTLYYLTRLYAGAGIEYHYEPSDEAKAKHLEEVATKSAQARAACEWVATNEEPDFHTLAVEIELRYGDAYSSVRLFLDHLVWSDALDALVIRDHKFTWKWDDRTRDRERFSDQELMYAAVWNRDFAGKPFGRSHTSLTNAPALPRVEYYQPHIIVVREPSKTTRGNQNPAIIMPCDPVLISPEKEALFWSRLERQTQEIRQFETQVGWDEAGKLDARLWQRTESCVTWSRCPMIPICHLGETPDAHPYRPSRRGLALATQEEGAALGAGTPGGARPLSTVSA